LEAPAGHGWGSSIMRLAFSPSRDQRELTADHFLFFFFFCRGGVMCDEERREGKEELYLTSSRVDLTGEEEKKRGEEEKKNFNSRVLEFSSWQLRHQEERRRKEKRGGEGTGRRPEGEAKEFEKNFHQFWETLGGRKKAKNRRRKGSFSLLVEVNIELLPARVAFAGFFGFLLLSYALLSLLPSLLSSHPSYELQRTILLSDAALNCYTLSYFMLFYPTNCIVLAFRKETKKKKEYE
jgi:hypothetical protein